MEPTIEETENRFKTFVVRHKVALAVTATTIVCVVVHAKVIKSYTDFLKTHELYDKFFEITEE